MTMILAANLSDKLILATDTLVTRMSPDGAREPDGLFPKLQHYAAHDQSGFVGACYAGSATFAHYLAGEISTAIHDKKLPTDIYSLRAVVMDFLRTTLPSYEGKKNVLIILGGTSFQVPRVINFNKINKILGTGAGKFDDPVVVDAMRMASDMGGLEKANGRVPVLAPSHGYFVIKIDEGRGLFEASGVSGAHNAFIGGSGLSFNDQSEAAFLKYFLSRKSENIDGTNAVNYIRNHFNDCIGGAVMLGAISGERRRGALMFMGYQIERSGNEDPSNWSFMIKDDKFIATDPQNREHDVMEHYPKYSGNLAWEI